MIHDIYRERKIGYCRTKIKEEKNKIKFWTEKIEKQYSKYAEEKLEEHKFRLSFYNDVYHSLV